MSDDKRPAIANLSSEDRTFPPPAAFAAAANAQASVYDEATADWLGFWEKQAKERITWFNEPTVVLDDSQAPFFKWFSDGTLNVSYNCLDRHLDTIGDKVAYHWIGEPGDTRTFTYRELYEEVTRFANALSELGVERGDRVAIYLGMIPELPIAMLACARIGAPHSVVFGGFSADALASRINDAEAKVVITQDGAWRRGEVVPLKANADVALVRCPTIEHSIVVRRARNDVSMTEGRDLWYDEIIKGQPTEFEPAVMHAEDMLYILYTSGTTGKPKGIVHTQGGYLTGVTTTHDYVFDLKPDDVYWCAADIGWVTGHSYIVYGPLANGATGVMYEGAPNFPDNDRLWQIIEEYRVTIFYTAPTAIRAFMKWGDHYPAAHDLSSLRLLGTVGEPINPEAWMWYQEHIGGRTLPDRRHLVADRNRGDHDCSPARGRRHQTGISDLALPGHRSRRHRRRGQLGSARWRWVPRAQTPVAVDVADDLRGPGPLRADLLVQNAGRLLRRRRMQAGRRRLLLAPRTGRRRDADRRTQHLNHGGRIGPGVPPRRR